MDIDLKLNEQQQELLTAILHTYMDQDTISNTTKAVINQLLAKIEEEYESTQ